MSDVPTLRIARPTDRLEAIVAMYRDGLALDVLGSFEDHDGFDGVMLGRADWPYHLEFTHERGKVAGGAPSGEHLLVFYEPEDTRWRAALKAVEAAGFVSVRAHNPYWDERARSFEDLDGYRIVLQHGDYPPRP